MSGFRKCGVCVIERVDVEVRERVWCLRSDKLRESEFLGKVWFDTEKNTFGPKITKSSKRYQGERSDTHGIHSTQQGFQMQHFPKMFVPNFQFFSKTIFQNFSTFQTPASTYHSPHPPPSFQSPPLHTHTHTHHIFWILTPDQVDMWTFTQKVLRIN